MEDYNKINKAFRETVSYTFYAVSLLFCCFNLHTYLQDEDVTRIEYHNYNHNEDDIYPSLSLCFARNIFVDKQLKQLGNGISSDSYQKFLMGLTEWTYEMSQINYEDVTMRIENYLISGFNIYSTGFAGFTRLQNSAAGKGIKFKIVGDISQFYIGYQDFSTKCFTVDFKYKKERTMTYALLVFQKDMFPTKTKKHPNFGVYLHYPMRLLKDPTYKLLRIVSKKNQTAGRFHYFKIQEMEVIRKRNKPKSPCQHGWNNIDDQIKRVIVTDVGCNPPYWNISSFADCTNQSKLQELSARSFSPKLPLQDLLYVYNEPYFKEIVPSCQEIKSINYQYDQIPIYAGFGFTEKDHDDYIQMLFHLEERNFKVINQMRRMDLAAFFSACGGNLGLFAGMGVLQIILFFHEKAYVIFTSLKNRKISQIQNESTQEN